MGVSSSKSKSTTTPTNPQWVTDAMQSQTGRVNDFMARDPQSLVAGPSALQQQAFADVQNLGGWREGSDAALAAAGKVGKAGANTFGGTRLGAADQVGQTTIAPVSQVQGQSLLDNFQNYMDPATEALVTASMNAYDAQAGQSRAAMQAQAARSGAFGGSRYGIAQGQFEADTDRNRALADAQLRANAFAQAAALSASDADRRQGANLFNAGAENTRSLNQAGLDQSRLTTNAGFNNDFKISQAGFDQQTGMFNAQQREAALSRQLQAAGLSAEIANSIAANERADLGMTAELGNIQQQIEQAQAFAPATQLALGSQALGAVPYGLFNGQTTTQKSNPSLFGTALGGASLFF